MTRTHWRALPDYHYIKAELSLYQKAIKAVGSGWDLLIISFSQKNSLIFIFLLVKMLPQHFKGNFYFKPKKGRS